MKNPILILIVAGLALISMSYNACSRSGGDSKSEDNSTSTVGNPKVILSIAPYELAGNSFVFCTSRVILVPKNSGTQNVMVNFPAPQQVSVQPSGADLGSLNIPFGNYEKAIFEVNDVCGTGKSLEVTNGNGTFKTSNIFSLKFLGLATIGAGSQKITFHVDPIVENLQVVSSDAAVPAQATASSGAFQSSNLWQPTATAGAPSARVWSNSIWTGTEMIVWGGCNTMQDIYQQCQGLNLATGGRYNPSTDTWAAMSNVGAPSPRHAFAMAWTGSKLIVWGGTNDAAQLHDGGIYDPSTDSWTATSTVNAPATGIAPAFVWTGTELIVWSGENTAPAGGRYNPLTNSWTAMTLASAPEARAYSSAVWTGAEMLVWGGVGLANLNSGGRYNPSTDSWTSMTLSGAPSARSMNSSVWTGQEMIIWGGSSTGASAELNDGGRYNPSTDSWTAMPLTNAPSARVCYSIVWTGQEVIIWGGGEVETNDGGRYNPSTNTWAPISSVDAPSVRYSHSAVWSGTEMIIWGGKQQGFAPLNTGGRLIP